MDHRHQDGSPSLAPSCERTSAYPCPCFLCSNRCLADASAETEFPDSECVRHGPRPPFPAVCPDTIGSYPAACGSNSGPLNSLWLYRGCPAIQAALRARPAAHAPRAATAAEQRDELAPFQLIEGHSVPCQPGPDCRISNWRGSVRREKGPSH